MGCCAVKQDGEFAIEFNATGREFHDESGWVVEDIEIESITIGSLWLTRADAMKMDHKSLVDVLFRTAYDAAYEGDFE